MLPNAEYSPVYGKSVPISYSSRAPDVTTVADDDPDVLDPGRILDQGRNDDLYDISPVNTIDVAEILETPHADVLLEEEEAIGIQHLPQDTMISAINKSMIRNEGGVLYDPDLDRAQMDTGTMASVTGKLHILHHYRPFTKDFPCPIRLKPATEGSDTTPKGMGYMFIEAPNEEGFLAAQTFYHPDIRTTVINEQDLVRSPNSKPSDFRSERLEKHHDSGTWTYTGYHKIKSSKNVVVHGVVIDGKCYTHGLILPTFDRDHPLASQ